jgi:hypothetical protein
VLTIKVPISERHWDELNEEFVTEEVTLELEHSLVSLSKWESFYEKPFLSTTEKSTEEVLWYVRAMTLTPDVPDEVFEKLTSQNYNEVNTYINAAMTATWFSKEAAKPAQEIITAEVVYQWMVAWQIDWEAQHWHLNRLLTLIRVCAAKTGPQKKMSRNDAAQRQRALNEARKAQYNTRG